MTSAVRWTFLCYPSCPFRNIFAGRTCIDGSVDAVPEQGFARSKGKFYKKDENLCHYLNHLFMR